MNTSMECVKVLKDHGHMLVGRMGHLSAIWQITELAGANTHTHKVLLSNYIVAPSRLRLISHSIT